MPGFDPETAEVRRAHREHYASTLCKEIHFFAAQIRGNSSTTEVLIDIHIAFLDTLFPRVNTEQSIISQGRATDIRQHVAEVRKAINEFASTKEEQEMVIFYICNKLLWIGGAKIVKNLSIWESNHFRVKV